LNRKQVEAAYFAMRSWLAALDDFRNWLIREAA
jgi:hypothetical protein